MSHNYSFPCVAITTKGLRIIHSLQEGKKNLKTLKAVSGCTYDLKPMETDVMPKLVDAGLVEKVSHREYVGTDKGAWYLGEILPRRDVDILDARNKEEDESSNYKDAVAS